ncbi:MAG: helix-turn-helix transcriptional regulator [Oscillospiraceae bacterium]|nr:helix-turn-helix transcriptional regulator [Oscillospiraceae bacterium]
MCFSEKLKAARKARGLSQEELAELLAVSRQAVSKWEQGESYPEVEKLLQLCGALDVSMDELFAGELGDKGGPRRTEAAEAITIRAPLTGAIVRCRKIFSSGEYRGRRKFTLMGSDGSASFWGENTSFLGWYADKETLRQEMDAIGAAMDAGLPSYELRWAVSDEGHKKRIKGILIAVCVIILISCILSCSA